MSSLSDSRVDRERAAHEEDDVLGRSLALKQRFSHSLDNPARNLLAHRFDAMLKSHAGKHVLDYGCGKGEYALIAASNGAHVEGIDISQVYVDEAARLIANAKNISGTANFQVMDAHKLSFAEGQFDLVIGNGILHHLDFVTALDEVRRVLKPGGLAVFQEPLGDNPLLKLFRTLTPSARTEDERPFYGRDIAQLSVNWDVESEFFGLFCAPVAIVTSVLIPSRPDNVVSLERTFLKHKFLNSWHQYILFQLRRPSG